MKILVILLQTISKGHIPYIVVFGRPQPKNGNDTFGGTVVKACVNVSIRKKKNMFLLIHQWMVFYVSWIGVKSKLTLIFKVTGMS